MTLSQKSARLSAPEGLRILKQLADPADPGFDPLAALLDQRYWNALPSHLRLWIRGEVGFKN